MRTIWLVIKHDVGVTLRQRSFWILMLLMPALLLVAQSYYVIRDNGAGNASPEQGANREEATTVTTPADMPKIGLVDEAGLIVDIPAGLPPDLFLPFPDEATARAALEAEEIEQYVRIPADYIATGEVTVYDRDFQILRSGQNMGVAFHSANEWTLRYLIDYNLTGDEQLLTALRDPTPPAFAERHAINPPVESEASDQALAQVVSSVMPYIYYFLLLLGSNYLMRSVVAEKENRTVEVLLLSVPPRELMVGKILAMSVTLVVQLVVWVGGGALILNRGADLLNVSGFAFPPGFFVWALLFLVFGYLLFASLMAAAGAIAPTAREGAQMTWLLIVPLMPTLMFGALFLEEPNSPLVLALSLFPFSAPSAMVTRLAVAEVPLWQILVSLAGLAGTTYLFVALAGRFFRAGNLLSQASFSWRRLATGWRK
jgi:ABC-2 type transport system permease protein